jgi:Beta-propeller repeat
MRWPSIILSSALLAFVSSGLSAQLDPNELAADDERAQLPLVFELNRGQVNPDVSYVSKGPQYDVLLAPHKTDFLVPSDQNPGQMSDICVQLINGSDKTVAEAADLLPGKSNYFIGKDSSRWITNIPQYRQVGFKSIYPGIDAVYYGNSGRLEYDFVLAPGSDPKNLRFLIKGADRVYLDDTGDLHLAVSNKTIDLHKPVAYQSEDGVRNTVSASFTIGKNDNVVAIDVGPYDRRQKLVVDPALTYSTLIGVNNGVAVQGIAVDPSGNVYITGPTFATNYPTVKAFQSTNNGTQNLFVTKLNPAGNVILYSTYLGGSGFDNAAGIAVDSEGSAYVTGTAGSGDFPTTTGAFMTTCPSPCNTPFVSKFLTDGTISFSTYMGGSNSPAHAIAVDGEGETYIAGDTASNDLPTTPGSFQPVFQGSLCTSCINGYVEKLNASGTALVYSTYFGAVGYGGVPSTFGSGIAVDSTGSAYLAGNTTAIPTQNPIQAGNVGTAFTQEPYITKFSADGSSLVFSTYLGGSSGGAATGVAVDTFGNTHVTGTSNSCDFPLNLNAFNTNCLSIQSPQQIFVTTLNPAGSEILFSTFLQSGFTEGIAVDASGNTYITGIDTSNDISVLNPIEGTPQYGGASLSSSNSFITELDLSGNPLFSTYLGQTGGGTQTSGLAIDSKENIYVAGLGQGDFPILHPIPKEIIQNTNYTIFVAKISPKNTPQFSLSPRVSPILTLRNVSSVPLTINSITTSANFTQGGTCGSTLGPGTGCTLILEGAADKKTSGTVTIASNAYSKPQEFVITKSPSGNTVGSILNIYPLYPQFPVQFIGTTSAPQDVTISNSGTLPAAINSIQMIEPAAFVETNDCPAMLSAGASCTISITYTAANQGDSAQIAIIADPDQTRYTVFLNGIGSSTALATSVSSMSFGTQYVGAAPLGRMVNIYNTTPYTASITGISTSTEFSETNTCTGSLAPHVGCRVLVTYSPATNEVATGTLTVGGLGPGGSQNVSLNGNGFIVSSLAVSPIPLDLYADADETPRTGVITIANTGSSTVKLTAFKIASPFSQSNNCHGSLAPAASCSVTITFKPTQVGVFNATLSITNSGPNSPQVVPVVGTAQTVFGFDGTTPIMFGESLVGTPLLGGASLANFGGGGNVTVSSVTVQGTDFKLTSDTCPTVYPPYLGCGPEITFTPSSTGLRTGTITVVDSDPTSPHVATLQGIGVSNGQGALSVTSLNFGTQSVGTTSASKTVTLKNVGTGVLTLEGIAASPQFAAKSKCPSTLKAGASCTIPVQFAPTLLGILDGSLSVQDDGPGSPHAVTLSGISQ